MATLLGILVVGIAFLCPRPVGAEPVRFETRQDFPSGPSPYYVLAAELNTVAGPDVVVVNHRGGEIDILYNLGNGTFAPAQEYALTPSNSHPHSVCAADFDQDGDLDLVVANRLVTRLSVLENLAAPPEGQRRFAVYSPDSCPQLVYLYSEGIVARDFNQDGLPDLAVATGAYHGQPSRPGRVCVFLNDGIPGRISFSEISEDYEVGVYPKGLWTDDLNGDSLPDLVVTNRRSNTITALFGDGDGTFSGSTDYPVGKAPNFVCAADFDGDSWKDLAVVNQGDDNVMIFQNKAGRFRMVESVPVAEQPKAVYPADLDGDGEADLAVSNMYGYGFTFARNVSGVGSAWFEPAVFWQSGDQCKSLFPADFDLDGDLDIVTANHLGGNVSLLRNVGGSLSMCRLESVTPGPRALCAADFDSDGDQDLAVVSQLRDSLSILRSDGAGNFSILASYRTRSAPVSICSGNFFAGDAPDLAIACQGSDAVVLMQNTGAGTFLYGPTYAVGRTPTSLCASDLNGDGRPDLAVAATGSDSVWILLNRGDGLGPGHAYAVSDSPASVTAADLNEDGFPDVVTSGQGCDSISVLINNGSGSFLPARSCPVGVSPRGMCWLDIDRDGDLDLAVADFGEGYPTTSYVTILLNEGGGVLARAVDYPVGRGPMAVSSSDLDRNGWPDLIVANEYGFDVSIIQNFGPRGFGQSFWGTGGGPTSIAIADFNGDDLPDIAATAFGYIRLSPELTNTGWFTAEDHIALLLNLPPNRKHERPQEGLTTGSETRRSSRP